MKILFALLVMSTLNPVTSAKADEVNDEAYNSQYCQIELADQFATEPHLLEALAAKNYIVKSTSQATLNGNQPALVFVVISQSEEYYSAQIQDRLGNILSVSKDGAKMHHYNPEGRNYRVAAPNERFSALGRKIDDCPTVMEKLQALNVR